MTISTTFVRFLFLILSMVFMTTYMVGIHAEPTPLDYATGASLGLGVGVLFIGIDQLFKRFNLRALNIAILGLFIGYLLGFALVLIFNALITITAIETTHTVVEGAKILLFLFGAYLGVIMTLRSSNELCISIPYLKFTPETQQVRDILLDLSALCDARLIDLAASGLLDRHLVLPRFLLKELQEQEEEGSTRAKSALEVAKKLETLPELCLRYQETDFPDVKECNEKVLRLARLLNASVLSADLGRVQIAQTDGLRVISINALATALKPLMQRGEEMSIKVQRHGKEEMQGVGYLEDGTMVVVNGGGDYIGDTITVHVLSVKHTASGRMIFCNVAEECIDE